MTSQYLILDLKSDEGFRAEAYPDPLSGGDPWTVGFGSTGPNIKRGTVWTEAQAETALVTRVSAIAETLAQTLDWYAALSDLRQDVLCNMAYNLGTQGLLAFHHTLTAMSLNDWEAAARGMLASKWTTQVPNRAKRLAEQMRTGVHA